MTWVASSNFGAMVWAMGPYLPLSPSTLDPVRATLYPADAGEIDFVLVPAGLDPATATWSSVWYDAYRYGSPGSTSSSSDSVSDDGLDLWVLFFNVDYDDPVASPFTPSVTGDSLVPADDAAGGTAPPPPAPPSNDDFADAIVLAAAGHLPATTAGATLGPYDSHPSVWYSWTAAADGPFAAAISGADGSGSIDVLRDNGNLGVEGGWTFEDSATFFVGGQQEILVRAVAGQRYWLRVNSDSEASGTLWWGIPDTTDWVVRDPVAFDDTDSNRGAWINDTGLQTGADYSLTDPLPYRSSSAIGNTATLGVTVWTEEWVNRGSAPGYSDTQIELVRSQSRFTIWKVTPDTFSVPASGMPGDAVNVEYDTADGTNTVIPDNPVRVRSSFKVITGWETLTSGPDPQTDRVYVFNGGGIYQTPGTYPTDAAAALAIEPADLTLVQALSSLAEHNPGNSSSGLSESVIAFDIEADPTAGLAVLDLNTQTGSFEHDPNLTDDLIWAHVGGTPPVGWPDPPYRALAEPFLTYAGHVVFDGQPYRVTGTYTPAPYRWVHSIIGSLTFPPLRQVGRPDASRQVARSGIDASRQFGRIP